MLFLQVDTSGAERFFETSPDTVFGLLTGALAIAVIVLWWAYHREASGYTSKLVELNVSCVETLKDVAATLERLRDAGVNMNEDLRREVERTREHIAQKIDGLTAPKN